MDTALLLIGAVFTLAGFVKGTLGLGLPTVAIGLLALRMPPLQALAITIVPAILTNIWQAFAGPHLRAMLLRLWPMLIAAAIGVWITGGLITGPLARYGTVLLGVLLVVYAAISLAQIQFFVPAAYEKPIGAAAGFLSGVVSSITGVQVIPSMPFLQAIGLGKEEFVQGIGLFFMVTTVALIFNLSTAGLITAAAAIPGLVALIASFAGMYLGQLLRERMHPVTFRRWFLISLLVFGLYLAGNAILTLYRA